MYNLNPSTHMIGKNILFFPADGFISFTFSSLVLSFAAFMTSICGISFHPSICFSIPLGSYYSTLGTNFYIEWEDGWVYISYWRAEFEDLYQESFS